MLEHLFVTVAYLLLSAAAVYTQGGEQTSLVALFAESARV
jgi:hypothetical protein